MDLNERKRIILKEVIDLFISTGEPVGSKAVMERLKDPCSSATIRNEMNALEKMGLLEQPHTSSGRVPTARGYRIYVDSLMENYNLSFEETLLLNALLSEKKRNSEKILEDMADLLSRMTGYTVAVFAKESCGTVERFDGVFVTPRSFLLMMITSQGNAIPKLLQSEVPLNPEAVTFLVKVINEHLSKKELGGITLERMIAMEKDFGEYRSIIPPLLQLIYEVMEETGRTKCAVKGIANLLSFPEFLENRSGEIAVRELEDHEALKNRYVAEFPSHLRIHIGKDKPGLDSASFLTCPFRLKQGMQGAVCILGPRRMNYANVVAKLQYFAKEIHAVHGLEPSIPLIETKET